MSCRFFLPFLAAASAGGAEHCKAPGSLECLGLRVENSWTAQLSPDPEQERYAPNKEAREVESGHYVLVRPSPLPDPYLAAYSPEVAALLELDEDECNAERFARLFSGSVDEVPGFNGSWATPYALSIYGGEQVPNGAGPRGYGYGDGRAISIAEVTTSDGGRWELQLKGSGTTPFCRGSDGRAVLRSSVREFLVSEAMHHLGVPTTRALSLVVSGSERVARPWYSEGQSEKHGGDVTQHERCAMTTRVSPSFIRVGHFDLFGRRARKGDEVGRQQLEELVHHTIFRDYAHLANASAGLQRQVLDLAAEVAKRFAFLAAEWIRVGYVQSNFNADNCLVSGRTLDYGPFGFVEKYDPKWGMWIHAGEHFAFMNQPNAAKQNFKTFASSLVPLLDKNGTDELVGIWNNYSAVSQEALAKMWARKLGFPAVKASEAAELWDELDKLLQEHPTDWTIFWRQLAELPLHASPEQSIAPNDSSEELEETASETQLLEILQAAFYEDLPHSLRRRWIGWLRNWLVRLRHAGRRFDEVSNSMKRASPKYVPRETMLVEAYTATDQGDHSALRSLQELFRQPYEEQASFGEKHYARRSTAAESQGGVGFMS